jgi:hypothetical protein
MLGAGKNLNNNVSAIKDKSAYSGIFKTVGDGLGNVDSVVSVDDLFTEKKVSPVEVSEPNFEDTQKKELILSPQPSQFERKRTPVKLPKIID